MISFILVTGPPFDAPLWAKVAARIESRNHVATMVPMLQSGDGSLESEANRLAHTVLGADTPVVLVAHGTAIPAALNASQKIPPSAMVMSNGPLHGLDLFTSGFVRWATLPKLLTENPFSTQALAKLMPSSIGFRRLVVNPYVMDHDTTVTVCGPVFESPEWRNRMRNYLRSLSKDQWQAPNLDRPTLLAWGDSDPLSRRNVSIFKEHHSSNIEYQAIPGGRYLHPIERPWELADRCVEWAQKTITTT